ncbi:uncharacterized protein LOC101776846 [Setaria italica]|nr:uncharacterized protein LOC101776846 [Setaria italica]
MESLYITCVALVEPVNIRQYHRRITLRPACPAHGSKSSGARMVATSISCCLGPPAPPKEAANTARRPSSLRLACVAAAACAVMGMAGGGGGGADMVMALARDGAVASRADDVAAAVGAPRWSDRRQCPAWRANSLENVVPENLPRAPARRRFSSVSISAAALAPAPDLVVVPPVLALRPGTGTGCFSL